MSNQLIDFFPRIRILNLDKPKNPKCAFTFNLSRHAKSYLTSATGFISSTKVTIKGFPLLRKINGENYAFRSLQLTGDTPKKLMKNFSGCCLSIIKPRFPHNYQPDVFLRSLDLMLAT